VTTSRVLLFDADDRVALVEEEGRWTPPAGDPTPAPVWTKDGVAYGSVLIAPEGAPDGARWWSLAELLAERPPVAPAELVDLIRRQLPSCLA
jgi:hypothetical protein